MFIKSKWRKFIAVIILFLFSAPFLLFNIRSRWGPRVVDPGHKPEDNDDER